MFPPCGPAFTLWLETERGSAAETELGSAASHAVDSAGTCSFHHPNPPSLPLLPLTLVVK